VGLAVGLGAASGDARTGGIVPTRLVGAFDTYLQTPNPTKRAHWVVLIGRQGSFVFTTPYATLLKSGPISVNGNTITIPPDASRGGYCATPGVYSWSSDGKSLTFTKVDDACTERIHRLTTKSWRRFTGYEPVVIIQK
jgi:hypothetical protein